VSCIYFLFLFLLGLYHPQIHVMDWINGMKVMKQTVRGWKDIETYARQNQWEGAFDMPLAAGWNLVNHWLLWTKVSMAGE
jgi:hypothetical protein